MFARRSAAMSHMAAAGEPTVSELKQAMRQRVRSVLRSLPHDAITAASAKVCATSEARGALCAPCTPFARQACQRLLALESLQSARSVSAYLEMPKGECQTTVLLEGLFASGKVRRW